MDGRQVVGEDLLGRVIRIRIGRLAGQAVQTGGASLVELRVRIAGHVGAQPMVGSRRDVAGLVEKALRENAPLPAKVNQVELAPKNLPSGPWANRLSGVS